MKGRAIHYSAAELRFIEARRTMPRAELRAAFATRFGRDDVTVGHLHALCKRKGWMTGRTGCFATGQTPHNKGKSHPAARNPNSARNWFRKGNAPHNTKWAGHERIDPKDGYVYISVEEPNPHTGYPRRYVLKHKWLWEQANGPLPEGMALKCIDGNRQNVDPSNWTPVPRALLPRLGGRYGRNYDRAPDALKPTILAVVKLEHAAREARKGRRQRA